MSTATRPSYPTRTVTLTIGRYTVTATEPATAEGRIALVGEAVPQSARRQSKKRRQHDTEGKGTDRGHCAGRRLH